MLREHRWLPVHTTVVMCRVLGQSSQSAQHRYLLNRTAHSPPPLNQLNNPSEQELRLCVPTRSGYRNNRDPELKHKVTGHAVHIRAWNVSCTHARKHTNCLQLPYIIESNPHPNLIRTSFCRFLKQKKKVTPRF